MLWWALHLDTTGLDCQNISQHNLVSVIIARCGSFARSKNRSTPPPSLVSFFTSCTSVSKNITTLFLFFLLIHYLCWFFVASRIPNSGRKYTNYSIISTSTSPFLVNNCRSDRWGINYNS